MEYENQKRHEEFLRTQVKATALKKEIKEYEIRKGVGGKKDEDSVEDLDAEADNANDVDENIDPDEI